MAQPARVLQGGGALGAFGHPGSVSSKRTAVGVIKSAWQTRRVEVRRCRCMIFFLS